MNHFNQAHPHPRTHPRGVEEEDGGRHEADDEGDAAAQLRLIGLVLHVRALQQHGFPGLQRQGDLRCGRLEHQPARGVAGGLKRPGMMMMMGHLSLVKSRSSINSRPTSVPPTLRSIVTQTKGV